MIVCMCEREIWIERESNLQDMNIFSTGVLLKFMLTSVETLTKFSDKCQSKLEDCHVRLQRIEAALILVEHKLSKSLQEIL